MGINIRALNSTENDLKELGILPFIKFDNIKSLNLFKIDEKNAFLFSDEKVLNSLSSLSNIVSICKTFLKLDSLSENDSHDRYDNYFYQSHLSNEQEKEAKIALYKVFEKRKKYLEEILNNKKESVSLGFFDKKKIIKRYNEKLISVNKDLKKIENNEVFYSNKNDEVRELVLPEGAKKILSKDIIYLSTFSNQNYKMKKLNILCFNFQTCLEKNNVVFNFDIFAKDEDDNEYKIYLEKTGDNYTLSTRTIGHFLYFNKEDMLKDQLFKVEKIKMEIMNEYNRL